MTEKSDHLILNQAFKYYRSLKLRGGSDLEFKGVLWDKCHDPQKVYENVLRRYKKENSGAEADYKDRNGPFKAHTGLPTHIFAKRLCKKILGTNVLF